MGSDDTIDAVPQATPGPVATSRGALPDHRELPVVARDEYNVGEDIAAGGMGRVYEARDRRLGRSVAIKELLPKNRAAAQRFEREARITARLQHPAIIHVYEAGRWPGGEPFYAMQKVSGAALDKVVAQRASLDERLGLVRNVIAVVDALAYAHAQRVIHRDLKPSNVLVGAYGETVVIDWGLAKDAREPEAPGTDDRAESETATVHGSVLGTPAYMPPEQAGGELVDERADVYALGALLYHVLAGSAPYRGTSSDDILKQVLAAPPRALREVEPDVPVDLAAIVAKAMQRDKLARYANAGELAEDLKRFETGRLVAARSYTTAQRLARWLRRNALVVSVVTAAVIISSIVGALSLRRVLAERAEAEQQRRVAAQQRAEAEQRRLKLLVERGRAQLEAGHAGRALVYLAEVVRQGASDAASRFLTAEAMRPFQAQRLALRTGDVLAVARASDGRIATSSQLGRVTLWRPDGTIEHELTVHHTRIDALVFDPSSRYLAAVGDSRVAELWNLRDPSDVSKRVLAHGLAGTADPAPKPPAPDATNSPDDAVLCATFVGTRVVTGGMDHTARVWDAATGAPVRMFVVGAPVRRVVASPAGDAIATVSDRGVTVWQLGGDRHVTLWPVSAETPSDARFVDGGRVVLVADRGGGLQLFDAASGAALAPRRAADAAIDEIDVGAAGRIISVGAGIARLWQLPDDLRSGAVPVARLGDGDIRVARFSPRGETVATGDADGTVRVWTSSGEPQAWLEGHAGPVRTLAFDAAGTELVSGATGDEIAKVWDVSPTGAVSRASAEHDIVALAGNAGSVALADASGGIALTGAAGKQVTSLANARSVCALAITSRDVLALAADGTVTVKPVAGGEPRSFATAADGCVLAAAAAGDMFATGSRNGVIELWDARTGQRIRALSGHVRAIGALAFSRDGTRLASGGEDANVLVWDVRAGTHGPPQTGGGAIRAIAFSPDDAMLLSGGDAEARLHAVDGTNSIALQGTTAATTAVAFASDGSRVVTGAADGAIRIWDASDGNLLGIRTFHRNAVRGIVVTDSRAWSAAGRELVEWDQHVANETPTQLDALIAERVPWRLEHDLPVRPRTMPEPAPLGSSFGVTRVRIGRPTWEVVDAVIYTGVQGTRETGYVEEEALVARILPHHQFDPTYTIWWPREPHPAPYAGEATRGVEALGLRHGGVFDVGDWTIPNGIEVLIVLAATNDAPQGRTADAEHGPMMANALFPLLHNCDLLRDGVVVDPDFDSMWPAASAQDRHYDGYSHMIELFGETNEFLPATMLTGTFAWVCRERDQTGAGWDLTIGPLVVRP